MDKTKLGLPVNILEGICYFVALLGGIWGIILLAVYIYLKEDNPKLRTSVKKAIVICLIFTIIRHILNLILQGIVAYGGLSFFMSFNVGFLTLFFSSIVRAIRILFKALETIVFVTLGFGAISGNEVEIPDVSKIFK